MKRENSRETIETSCDGCKKPVRTNRHHTLVAASSESEIRTNIKITTYRKVTRVRWAFCDDCFFRARKKYWKTRIIALAITPFFVVFFLLGEFGQFLGFLSVLFLILLAVMMMGDYFKRGKDAETEMLSTL